MAKGMRNTTVDFGRNILLAFEDQMEELSLALLASYVPALLGLPSGPLTSEEHEQGGVGQGTSES